MFERGHRGGCANYLGAETVVRDRRHGQAKVLKDRMHPPHSDEAVWPEQSWAGRFGGRHWCGAPPPHSKGFHSETNAGDVDRTPATNGPIGDVSALRKVTA